MKRNNILKENKNKNEKIINNNNSVETVLNSSTLRTNVKQNI